MILVFNERGLLVKKISGNVMMERLVNQSPRVDNLRFQSLEHT